MGDSWRIGVGPGARTDLITSGLFRGSRNPIFLMRVTLAGVFLVTPNVVSWWRRHFVHSSYALRRGGTLIQLVSPRFLPATGP
jgi:protein-S-isoprenylcysteine O-methyltransferase Ste14